MAKSGMYVETRGIHLKLHLKLQLRVGSPVWVLNQLHHGCQPALSLLSIDKHDVNVWVQQASVVPRRNKKW